MVGDRDTILELTAKIQELQNDIEWFERFSRCWIRTQWTFHVTSQPAFFPPFSRSWRNAEAVLWECQAATKGRQAFGTRMVYLETVLFFQRRLQHFIQEGSILRIPMCQNIHSSPHVISERQTPNRTLDPRCQSGPSARYSFDPSEGRCSTDYGADQQRLQISDLHFDNSHTSNVCLLEDQIQD